MDAEQTAKLILLALAGYLSIGASVALVFVSVGVNRVDPAARCGSVGFRLLILPGSIALWPWVLALWLRAGRTEPEK